MPKRRLQHRERPKRDAFQQHVSQMTLCPTRSDWQQLLSLTAAVTVESSDVIGIIADYLIGHRFVKGHDIADEHTSEDGKEFRVTEKDMGWQFAVSEFPICLSSAHDFSVAIRDALPANEYDKQGWSVAVGLWNKQTPIHGNALFMFSDFEMGTVDFATCEFHRLVSDSAVTIRRDPLSQNTTVSVTYDPSRNSCTFCIAGRESGAIEMPCGTPSDKWFPTVALYSSSAGNRSLSNALTLL